MRDRELVEYVQSLYKTGLGIREIARRTNKCSTSISRWCRKSTIFETLDKPITYQERKRKLYFKKDKINIDLLDINQAKLLLSTLYWCEGDKYPGTSRIEFVSSDEHMQLVFIKLMRKVFSKEIDESKFRVMLQLHTSHDKETIKKYWSEILNIPTNQFIKPHITVSQKNRYRHIYNGTCSLRYYDYRLLLRLMGMYARISMQIIGGVVKRSTTTVY